MKPFPIRTTNFITMRWWRCCMHVFCVCVFFFCFYCFFATNTTFFDSLRSLFWASLCFLECGLPKFSIAKIYSTYKCTTTIVTTLSTMKLYTNWHPTAAPVKVCVQQLYVIHMQIILFVCVCVCGAASECCLLFVDCWPC